MVDYTKRIAELKKRIEQKVKEREEAEKIKADLEAERKELEEECWALGVDPENLEQEIRNLDRQLETRIREVESLLDSMDYPNRGRIFISYNSADMDWAEWIVWILEEFGYSVTIQAWDFRPGNSFPLEMDKALSQTEKTMVVLSQDFLDAEFTHPEWSATFIKDPQGGRRRLIPVRVRACTPRGLLASIVYVDLVGLSEDAARKALIEALAERGKPKDAPPFPK